MSVVDLLLQGVIADEAVDVAEFPLAVAVDPAHRLGVVAGVPGGVEHDHAVGTDEVHPQAARPEGDAQRGQDVARWPVEGKMERREQRCAPCREQEDPSCGILRVVKLINESLPL